MLKQFLSLLNIDKSTQRYNDWKTHRDTITGLFTTALDITPDVKETIIFGAGNCDDLDLQFVAGKFDKVYLVDIDRSSMENALASLSEVDRTKFELIGDIDITGLTQLGFYQDLEKMLSAKTPVKKIAKYIRGVSLKSYDNAVFDNFKGHFDLVVSSAVYTQLCYIACLLIIGQHDQNYTRKEVKDIIYEASYLAVRRVEIFNDLLMSLGTQSAQFIVWTDLVEITDENSILLKHTQDYNKFFDLANKYNARINGGIEGLDNLIKRLKINNNLILRRWVWPFSDKKFYYVSSIIGQRK